MLGHSKIATLLCASLLVVSACTKEVRVELTTVGDTMAFDQKELVVPAGSKVTVVLKNGASSPAMTHNWILLKPGFMDEVGRQGITVPIDQGYIPDHPAIIAHTTLSSPGGTVMVTFPAPPPGTYEFICSVPGHFMSMRGTFIVR